jgi:hypothetical protein
LIEAVVSIGSFVTRRRLRLILIPEEDIAEKEAEESSDEEKGGSAVPAGCQSKDSTKKGSNASAKKSSTKK